MNELDNLIETKRQSRLAAYRNEPADIHEHAGVEETVEAGGYGYRQVLELVQNGADAIREAIDDGLDCDARIEVVLGERHLYVANTGAPLSEAGVVALLQSHSSPKRGNQIGRFGLGFKSLLRLGGYLDIFSRSGSLRFDPERCRQEIRQTFQLDAAAPAPGLRLAWALNRDQEEAADPRLKGFAWATTIVRAEILNADIRPHLQDEIRNFPSPFLLFLPTAVALELDAGEGKPRTILREPNGEDIVLSEGDRSSRWRVFEHPDVSITDEAAKADATHLHVRNVVPLTWAMPLDSRHEDMGRFWAFFPTQTLSRLPGILNAPWKLNSDRNGLIPGEWNKALMREAAKLVAEHLPQLATPDDPGRVLEAFPRQVRQDEIAKSLVDALWTELKQAEIIPDGNGVPRKGAALWRPPMNDADLLAQWRELADEEVRGRWVHPSCLKGERHPRLVAFSYYFMETLHERLREIRKEVEPANLRESNVSAWFAEIARSDIEHAKKVLAFAGRYAEKRETGFWQGERTSLSIIPAESGQLCSPIQVLIAPAGMVIAGRECVASALLEEPVIVNLLTETLGVEKLDETGWSTLLDEVFSKADNNNPRANEKYWQLFWGRLRQAPESVRKDYLERHQEKIRVRRKDDAWVLRNEALLPGRIVAPDDGETANQKVLVDLEAHAEDGEALKLLGISDFPSGTPASGDYETATKSGERKLKSWLDAVESDYRSKLDTSSSPQAEYLQPFSLSMPSGWTLLDQLTGLANANLTRHLLDVATKLGERVDFGHISRKNAYPVTQVSHPLFWFIRQHGHLALGSHVVRLATVLTCRERTRWVKEWNGYIPHFDRLSQLVGAPALPQPKPEQLKQFWQVLFAHYATPQAIEQDALGELWSAAGCYGQAPETLLDRPLTQIHVTASAHLARRGRALGWMAVTLAADTLELWLQKGALPLESQFRPKWDHAPGEAAPLLSVAPELAAVLKDDCTVSCLLVENLRLGGEEMDQAIPCMYWEGRLLLDPGQLDALPRSQRLAAILDEAAAANWLNRSADQAKRELADAEVEARRAHVAAAASLEERVFRAVGERRESLLQVIGAAGNAIPNDCPPLDLARLALTMRGPALLQQLKGALQEEGLQPPGRWGSDEARAFVASLGFPETFAVSATARRDAEEQISGPIRLPELHDYQNEVIAGLRQLIESGTGRRRAVVSLPTGAGKTRVTVQAAVELVLRPENGRRLLLWIAQTDELCEQAVQSFRQVWLNRGAERTDLRIVRFWGRHQNPAASAGNQPTVVVASIQTLNSRIGKEGSTWLNEPGLVVVDECHHAITPSYTGLLRWLDAQAPGERPEPPIIGLSATPFRGAGDEDENLRLARRFDQRWLPANQQALHETLTRRGILARADHEALRSPAVPPQELLGRLETATEIGFDNILNELNEWLASDEDRNRLLLDTIRTSSQRSILFFTLSRAHSEEMAVRLNLLGITAHAIDGDTPASARREFLERFQSGETRVLCNHSVLTTGFDAPKTDMVLIARHVRSPVRYMQMVGRGLRGVANGGTERCRIVTVRDNLGRFGERLPYDFCAKYFR